MSNLPAPGHRPPRPWTQGLLTVLIAAAAVYLISNHWLHVLDALPYLGVVLVMSLCMFGHGGHGHGGHGGHGYSGHTAAGEGEGAGHVH
ncbi:DUF2933 family protein [Arthrobacter sp. SLBN-100]|uniref:DUF2933 domain-containing protein n=1 Tax=Arthrobacter sp. SLBN-100 TaxID=2768450 RepID=UPI00116F53E6|nr:DUF2933 domain-containing protein [Arthrobacter sp. SLBN-100]TQJ67640.1 DUF2933 family protein [Arthrobacter sp. SLBN-100]